MKKLFSALLFVALLFSLFALPVWGQEQPLIIKNPHDVTVPVGDGATLECDAASPDGGEIKYAWYRCTDKNGADEGEELTSASVGGGNFTPPTTSPGVFYYYCAVYNVHEEEASMAKSGVATVTVTGNAALTAPEITEDLDRTYSVVQNGSLVLSVTCVEPAAPVALRYQWYGQNTTTDTPEKIVGATSAVYTVPTDRVGTYHYYCLISASNSTKAVTAQSRTTIVTVTEHVHAFGDWTITTPATCMTAGQEQRTCSCGTVETREAEALGHDFGDWTLTREATVNAEGEERRACSRCGISEVRAIAALSATDTTTTRKEETTRKNETTTRTEETTVSDSEPIDQTTVPAAGEPVQSNGQFPWWRVIIIFGVVCTLGGGAAAVWFFLRSRALSGHAKGQATRASSFPTDPKKTTHPPLHGQGRSIKK